MLRIETTEIDGVRVLWAETGDGATVGALTFGVGRVDETAAVGGITHLVEHLALAPFGQQDFAHNAFVDDRRSVFHATGTTAEVASHLGAVARSIHALPIDRLVLERRILRDEASQAGRGLGGALRWYRFGACGHGLAGIEELGLTWLGPDRVLPWAARRYTRDNAVMWLSTRPPEDLRLDLPAGAAPVRPPVATIDEVRFPAHVPWEGPGVAVSYLTQRTPAANVAAHILERRARQRLRFDLGLVYDIAFDYEPLTADLAHVSVGTDCPDERIPVVRDALLAVFDELAAGGPSPAELAAEIAAFTRGVDERDGRLAFLDAMAGELLLGEPIRQPDELLERRAAVTVDAARSAFGEALTSRLMLANTPPLDGAWQAYPGWSSSAVEGREFRPAGFHLPGRGPKERLVVGADGVMVRVPEGALTVRWTDVVAVVHETPDVRTIWGADGFRVVVAGPAWRDGAAAVAAVDAAVPAEVIACGEHGVGGFEDPEDQPRATTP